MNIKVEKKSKIPDDLKYSFYWPHVRDSETQSGVALSSLIWRQTRFPDTAKISATKYG